MPKSHLVCGNRHGRIFARLPLLLGLLGGLWLGAGTLAVAAVSPAARHSASLPVAGLFTGDRLSSRTRARLDDLIRGMQGMNVELAVMVPTGAWITEGAGRSERDLNEARMDALRAFLAERGIDPGRVFMESDLGAELKEPSLEVQLLPRRTR